MLSFNARKLPVMAPAKTDIVLLCQRISNLKKKDRKNNCFHDQSFIAAATFFQTHFPALE